MNLQDKDNNTELMEQFFHSFNFLKFHPMFRSSFGLCLDVEVVKLNPEYEAVDDNPANNTAVRVWLECGPLFLYNGEWMPEHDTDLDCGGKTFEEAIIELAKLVEDKYGTYQN